MTENERILLAVLVVIIIIVVATMAYKKYYPGNKGRFGDLDNWPSSGVFGNLADTSPYGNYADGLQMYWPTYNRQQPF